MPEAKTPAQASRSDTITHIRDEVRRLIVIADQHPETVPLKFILSEALAEAEARLQAIADEN